MCTDTGDVGKILWIAVRKHAIQCCLFVTIRKRTGFSNVSVMKILLALQKSRYIRPCTRQIILSGLQAIKAMYVAAHADRRKTTRTTPAQGGDILPKKLKKHAAFMYTPTFP